MTKNTAIHTIIFDVGNVLLAYDWETYLDSFHFSSEVRQAVASAVFLNPVWDELDRSLLPDSQYLEKFIQNAPQYSREIRQVYENCENCIHLYDYTASLIQTCRDRGFRTYILSNYSRYLFHKTKHLMDFRNDMDGEVFSFQVGQIKPEVHIYRSLLEKYSIDPRHALFFDDRQVNLDTAAQLGIHTVLFTSYEKALEAINTL